MNLDQLLQTDPDAARYFKDLPAQMQDALYEQGEDVGTLAALREYATNLAAQKIQDPSYASLLHDPTEIQKWCQLSQF